MKILINKIRQKVWRKLVVKLRNSSIYPYLYLTYWHLKIRGVESDFNSNTIYFSSKPNSGAGIGHQMANWIAGFWWAKQFQLKFAHIPFSSDKWNSFLDFGKGELTVEELLKKGYKKRKIPLFNENKQEEIFLVKEIIKSYSNEKVVFVCEQDQFYKNQFGVIKEIQEKFYNAHLRKLDRLSYINENYNVAIHVRRGDILADPNNPNLQMRYLENDYFLNVLKNVLTQLKTEKPIHVYFFSQGKAEDFSEFHEFQNLHWCLDMGAQESFAHMVYADLLITSKSSFSYKPALLSKNIKVVPSNFWHGYPNTKDWVLTDSKGNLNLY